MNMETLYTKRLELRAFREADLEAFHAYAKNPEVGPSAGWKPHESLEESADILRDFIRTGEVWAVTDREDGRLLGSVGLHPDRKRLNDRTRTLGYVLARPHWGQGYMTEAAEAVLAHAFDTL